jgi:hypothetical protein
LLDDTKCRENLEAEQGANRFTIADAAHGTRDIAIYEFSRCNIGLEASRGLAIPDRILEERAQRLI